MIDVNKEQRRAANPTSSVWVCASAGSGKTKVLTDRVLNLLLMTGQPEKILCLTFTKTAAAEMANRINNVLKSWVIMPEKDLIKTIENLSGDYPDEETIKKARRLFALTLETPGGMKIMTIHIFSQSNLKRFPLEAGVSPHFEVMDETSATDMLNMMTHEALKNPSLKEDIALLSSYLDEESLNGLLKEILSYRTQLIKLIENGQLKNILLKLKQYFNIDKYQSENQIILENYTSEEWPLKCKEYLYSDKSGIKKRCKNPAEAEIVWATEQKYRAYRCVEATSALLNIAYYIIELYERQKNETALLDYDDLIDYTGHLLNSANNAAWVLYKLDNGIDHILVDEAQDTNPKQWMIIRKLAEEFFSGEGRSDSIRTIFAVGDKKQSIYSFQGADPEEFERMRHFFEQKVTQSQNDFATVPFNFSFRSTEPVLRLVNFLLKYPPASAGVLSENEDGHHLAFREFDAGLVEIWPLEEAKKTDTPEGWKPPIERTPFQSPISRLAEKIAKKINHLITSKEILKSANRPIEAGDFLILVQRRNQFVNELVRFLKEYRIPVAGVDRLTLTNYIAVQDLLGMAKFALLPEDDLNLAEILKSPLLRLSEDDLFKICYNRGTDSVYDRVKKLYPQTAEYLAEIMDKADKVPPFEFFSYILSILDGRKNFEARLGPEVNEALDEFLNLALTYERNNIASLQSFLKWIGDKEIEIKRDMEQSDLNAVRIMTVHGSKGLQGNIVFLPDTRYVPSKRPSVMWTKNGLPIWIPKAAYRTEEMAQIIDDWDLNQMREYRRLLYVAVTRPKDRLYICGYNNKTAATKGNWYDLITEALPYTPDEDGIIRFSSEQTKPIESQKNEKIIDEMPITLPDWIDKPAPDEPMPSKPLRPSVLETDETAEQSALDASRLHSIRRGIFIHKLLQHLPAIPADKRKDVAEKLKPDDIDIPPALFHLMESEDFKHLFGPTSLAEVPVVGVVDNLAVSGQIDRLVVLEKQVLIVDYKSNYRVPQNIDDIPQNYKKQLNSYKALLKNIFPDKVVKTYLLWTQNLTWMEIE